MPVLVAVGGVIEDEPRSLQPLDDVVPRGIEMISAALDHLAWRLTWIFGSRQAGRGKLDGEIGG